VELPGGLVSGRERRRSFALRPLTGALELALAEAIAAAPSLPAAVTAALAQALAELGGEAPSQETVRSLCVGDRQYLLRRLQMHLGRSDSWRQAPCGACGERFDFPLDLAALPVVAAPPGYPFATVALGERTLRFRLPTGADQEAIARRADLTENAAAWELVRRCWVSGGRGPRPRWAELEALGTPVLEAIEVALEAVSPAIGTEVAAGCPQCGAENRVALDACEVLSTDAEALLREVHALAINYHWSEAAILELPPPRRQHYLRLIDEARGLVQ
jgi:hypothetical protein